MKENLTALPKMLCFADFSGSEMRMLREQETAMNKLKERRARFEMRLNETQRIVTEFKNRERMSDAPQYVEVFDQLKKRVEEFILEVYQRPVSRFLTFCFMKQF